MLCPRFRRRSEASCIMRSTSKSRFLGSKPNLSSPDMSEDRVALGAPFEPASWFCFSSSMCGRKRLVRRRVSRDARGAPLESLGWFFVFCLRILPPRGLCAFFYLVGYVRSYVRSKGVNSGGILQGF